MNPGSVNLIASTLAHAAIEGGLLALIVGSLVRLFPALPAATRTALWWLVSLRLFAGLVVLPLLVVPVPSLSRPPSALLQTTMSALGPVPGATHDAVAPSDAVPVLPRERSFLWRDAVRLVRPVAASAMPWVLTVWVAGLMVRLVHHVRTACRIARIWRAAEECKDPRIQIWSLRAQQASRGARLEVRVSHELPSPMLLAGSPARILLPQSCLALDAARLHMVLAHEAAHLRRYDLVLGVVPALAQCVFWFHPLAHWAAEEYAQAREEACDAEAMRACGARPHEYGELLLAYGIAPARHGPTAACYGSRNASRLRRRIFMLGQDRERSTFERRLALVVLSVVAMGALMPVRFVAAESRSLRNAVPVKSTRGAGTSLASASSGSTPNELHVAAPSLGRLHALGDRSSRTRSSSRSREDGFEYGCGRFRENEAGLEMSMSGTFDSRSMTWFKSLAKQNPDGFGWFKLDGIWYVVNDRAAIAEMGELMAVLDDLARRQGELGERQGKLADEQGRLGEMQGELGGREGELSGKLSEVEAMLAHERVSGPRRQQLRDRRAAMERLLEELSEKRQALEKAQDELARRQNELGAEQDAFGVEQDEFGDRVSQEMRALAKDLVKRGLAVRTNRR